MISFKRLMYVLAVCLCLAGYYEIVKYTGTGIPCLFWYIFHLQCPGCGVTHMLLAVLHGDLKEAFLSHPIIFCFSPFLGWILLKSIGNYLRCTTPVWEKWERSGMALFLAALLLFGMLRNIL